MERQGNGPSGQASTEPPMVIGGELARLRIALRQVRSASTEPPMVIGGEGWQTEYQRLLRSQLQRSRRW